MVRRRKHGACAEDRVPSGWVLKKKEKRHEAKTCGEPETGQSDVGESRDSFQMDGVNARDPHTLERKCMTDGSGTRRVGDGLNGSKRLVVQSEAVTQRLERMEVEGRSKVDIDGDVLDESPDGIEGSIVGRSARVYAAGISCATCPRHVMDRRWNAPGQLNLKRSKSRIYGVNKTTRCRQMPRPR